MTTEDEVVLQYGKGKDITRMLEGKALSTNDANRALMLLRERYFPLTLDEYSEVKLAIHLHIRSQTNGG